MLEQLKALEKDNLIQKKVYDTFPKEVGYTLTVRGKTLIDALKSIEAWANEHVI